MKRALAFVAAAPSVLWTALASGALWQSPPAIPAAPASPPIAAAPATPVTGSLTVHLVQGTPGEPAIGSLPIEIELYHRGMLFDTIKTTTDEQGLAVIDPISLAMSATPVVKVKYANLDYQIGGGMLDGEHPHQDIEVVCFAATETPPAWKIGMRHMMVVPEADGLRVTEMLLVVNPDHRTWIGMPWSALQGAPPKDSAAKRVTTSFALPAGAKDVELGRGFHKWCCSTLTEKALVNHLPLMPESSEMMFTYLLPPKDGVVTLDISAPVAVDSTMLVIPASVEAGALEGLDFSGEQVMGENKVRVYMAAEMTPGQKASISVRGFAPVAPGAASAEHAAPQAAGSNVAKIVAAVGGGGILLVAAVLLLRKPAGASVDKRAAA